MSENNIKSCVVTVRFENGKEYPYFNDRFELEKGDKVFVDGKLFGKLGTVIDKTYQFKVSKSFYKYVINKLDFDVHSDFEPAFGFMIAKGNDIVDNDQFVSWFKPPFIPTDEDPIPEEYFIGEGYSQKIGELEIDGDTIQEAVNILHDDALKGILVKDGVGVAVMKDSDKTHIIDFKINGDSITDMYCDCMDAYFCEHLAGFCIVLDMFIKDKHITTDDSFFAICEDWFVKIIDGKKVSI
ncbi:MAG: hypothetical protein MR773_01865 [Eubacterium coprostanoligenes]|nr:hypothetical protein [Eubacterium coprostanoligenes]